MNHASYSNGPKSISRGPFDLLHAILRLSNVEIIKKGCLLLLSLIECLVRKSKIHCLFFCPHFRYCCSVWGCCGSREINQLQKLQNRAARIVTNSSFDTPSRPLIERLGWRTIEQLISIESKTVVFKSLNELAPQYLSSLFKRNSQCSCRCLRNTETDLRVPQKTSANGQKCFSFRGAKLWNSLLAESKQASSLNNFKKSVQR